MENNAIYQVAIAPAANDRMYDHFEFLARVSESAAERLLDGLVADIRSLEHMPYRNPVYDRPYLTSGKYRYMLSCGRYRIVYRSKATTYLSMTFRIAVNQIVRACFLTSAYLS